jgi:hypothetical protein
MPRYLVERSFPNGLKIPNNPQGREATAKVAANNSAVGVTWVLSYVGPENRKTFCIYDGPDEAAIRNAAERNGLPVDKITAVSVLDPYFYVS